MNRLPANHLSTSQFPKRFLFLGALLTAMTSLSSASPAQAESPSELLVYVGTYSGPKSEGIYAYRLDLKTGKCTPLGLAAKVKNPSFLAVHPTQEFLYSVSEIEDRNGKPTGGVSAFSIDRTSGKLAKLNDQSSEGRGPCHVTVDKTGKVALVANYGGGSVASLPIGADGKLAPAASAIQHEGKSANPERQEGPHAHSINPSLDNRFAVAADLGLDKVLVYKLDPASGTLAANDPPSTSVKPGAGPRHFAFHPSGKYAYVINEIDCTVTAFAYDAEKGVLTELQTLSTLPADYKEKGNSKRSARCPRAKRSSLDTAPPKSRCTRAASSCTAQTAGTTPSPCSPSTRPTANCGRFRTLPSTAKCRAGSASTPPESFCSPAGRPPTRSPCFALIRSPASLRRRARSWKWAPRCA